MKIVTISISFLFATTLGFSQKQVLGDYDFLSKNYKLFIFHNINDSDTSFRFCSLLDSKVKLDSLKKVWMGTESESEFHCGYDNVIYLTDLDSIVDELDVNAECGQVVSKHQIINFKGNPFKEIKTHSQVYHKKFIFTSLDSARKKLRELSCKKTYYIPYKDDYDWVLYDGYFAAQKPYNFINKRRIIKNIEKQIKTINQNPNKHIEIGGFNSGLISLLIHCDYNYYKSYKAKYKTEWNSYENGNDLRIYVFSDDPKLLKE